MGALSIGASRGGGFQAAADVLALPPFPALHTARLRLREMTAADAQAVYAIHADADAMRWFGTDPPADLGAAHGLIEGFAAMRRAANPGTRWGIVREADGRLVGSVGLMGWNRHTHACATGYELARSAWGHGFMREALAAVLAWGFEHMHLNRIGAQIHADNLASRQLVRALGFQEEGVLRDAGRWGGRFHDLTQFALLKRDFSTTAAEHR